MSSSAELGQNATLVVQSHVDDWQNESIDSPAQYKNIIAPLECIAEMDWQATVALYNEMKGSFNTDCTYDMKASRFQCNNNGQTQGMPSSALAALKRGQNTSIDTIRESIDSMTKLITTKVRQEGMGAHSEAKATVEGEVWESKVCVHVEWKWLSIPATLFVLCSVQLLWTVVKSGLSKDGLIWKGSVLPFLLKDHPGLERMELTGVNQVAKRLQLKCRNSQQ
jgi:hypothetical protein